jgi:hypothetical protein
MASRCLRADHEVEHGRFYQGSERMFNGLLHPDVALKVAFTASRASAVSPEIEFRLKSRD